MEEILLNSPEALREQHQKEPALWGVVQVNSLRGLKLPLKLPQLASWTWVKLRSQLSACTWGLGPWTLRQPGQEAFKIQLLEHFPHRGFIHGGFPAQLDRDGRCAADGGQLPAEKGLVLELLSLSWSLPLISSRWA